MDRTETALARERFLAAIGNLPGACTAACGGGTTEQQTILVYVGSLGGPDEDRVYEELGNVLRAYPQARLNVEVDRLPDLDIGGERLSTAVRDGGGLVQPVSR